MLDLQLGEDGSVESTAAREKAARVAEIETWLVTELAQLLKVKPDEIDTREPFAHYGLGSIQGLELAAKLEDWIGFRLPPTLVWDYPNVELVARKLVEDPEGVAAAADYEEDW